MYTTEDITIEKHYHKDGHYDEWWVFPDGLHVNKSLYPTKEDALYVYRIATS